MAAQPLKADTLLLKSGTFVGRCPDSGIVYRLKITTQGQIHIERKSYVSSNPDGWTQTYPILIDDAEKHIWLILKIKQNPAQWSK